MSALRPYLALISGRFRVLLQYRAAAIAGLWTQAFFGAVLIMIYESFYAAAADPATRPMTLAQLVTYVWLGQATFCMLPWNADGELRELIRSGAVAYELCRPMDLYCAWYARALALRTAPTVLRGVPMLLVAMLVLPLVGLSEWRLAPPPTLGSGLAFLAALGCALLLGCAVTMLINISFLWTLGGDGMVVLGSAAVTFFSGMLIPLPLFPGWAARVVTWLPFAGLVDLPFRLYSGNLPPTAIWLVLLRQLGWTAALVLWGRRLLARGMRRVVVQGG